MDAVLIWSRSTPDEDLGALSATLRAELPVSDVVFDEWQVLERVMSRLAASAYEPEEPAIPGEAQAPQVFDVVTLVLPAITPALVQVAVDVAVSWLRQRRERQQDERAVVIYGPNGEPLRKIRLRDATEDPQVFNPPWPLPRSRGRHSN
jgi:hypothetical protein